MSQESSLATVVSVAGRSAAQTQPSVSIGSTYPPISTLLSHAGLRYPICALQGGSLIYSPMMGQTLFPWRPFTPVATPTTPVSVPNVSLIPPTTQATPTTPLSLASLMQVPGYSYMTVSSLLGSSSSAASPVDEHTQQQQQFNGSPLKRENSSDTQSPELSVKKPRLSQDTLVSNPSLSDTHTTFPIARVIPSGGSLSTSPTESNPHPPAAATVPEGTGNAGSQVTSHVTPGIIIMLKCLGSINPKMMDQYNLKTCTLIQELYYPSRLSSSTNATPSLSPETYALLTINYLNSLREGECISLEVMKAVFQNTLSCESQWVQYYHKHKKMTESTFVQSQFVHFARISMYSNSSKVWVIVSQTSLSEGVSTAFKSIEKSDQSLLPKFIVVIAVLQNIPIELCVMVVDRLQCKWVLELQRTMKPASLSESTPLRLSLAHELLSAVKRSQTRGLCDFHAPFLIPGKEYVTAEEANHINPTASHIIEHKPIGPFTQQYSVALLMLQKVLHAGHLDQYQRVDFFVLSPAYPPLLSQLVGDIEESGLVQLLGIADHKQEIVHAINNRLVPCVPSSIDKMNDVISKHRTILFLLISKCAHLTTSVTLHHQPGRAESLNESGACDNRSILSHSNTVLLYTTPQPYSLQTNRSPIPAANEIHWPISKAGQPNGNQEMCSGMEYCCLLKQNKVPLGEWLDLRDDNTFEERVDQLCNKEKLTTPISAIRAQVLLNDYVSALVLVARRSKGGASMLSALPETLAVITKLVQGPKTSGRGLGSMVIIRCHDKVIGTDIFSKLKLVRNALGLQYRFEVLLDHGDGKLNISDYFQKRLKVWGVAMEGVANPSYKELENLPCLVVMTGRGRPNVRLPSSLSHVDLRLCHTHLTRTLYESDLSILSGYRHVLVNAPPTCVPLSKHQSPTSSFKSEKLDSTASSSSVTSSDAHTSSNNNVVEWKPVKDPALDHTHWEKNVRSPSDKLQFEYNSTEMDCTDSPAMNEGGVAIVEIPQPEDHMTNEVVNPILDAEENLFDELDGDSDYEDSETEEEGMSRTKVTCLLSRQYYLIWKSGRMINHSLLLPPSDGVIWQATNKRTILTDHTPSVQSSYYRTWSKPEGKARRVAMDTILKESSEERKKSFLLIGPAQVGKLGACLLLVRLLHEYLRSSQGVTAITRTPTLLPLISPTPPPSPLTTSFSPIVSIDLLTAFRDKTKFPPSSFYLPASETKTSSVLINAHPSIVHDSSHSCPKCSSKKGSGETTPTNYILSSVINYNSASQSVQWSIPASKVDMVSMTANGTFECIKLPLCPLSPNPAVAIPIFTISPDLKELALLNMTHTADKHLHIVVTKLSSLPHYQKSWPNHIIVGLPDDVFSGSGSYLSAVKALGQWNYHQNLQKNKNSSNAHVLPWLLLLNDTVCMIMDDAMDESVSLSTVIEQLIKKDADVSSLKHWCSRSDPPGQTYALDSNFLLLNLSKLADYNFNPLNFKSADIDYHLRLLSNGHSVYVPSQLSYIRKLVKADRLTSLSDLTPHLLSHPDRLVTSLHHDTSSLLSYPGPLLLETFLLHKSHTLFPFAHTPHHPVLMIDNYINLGPKVHVSLVPSNQLPNVAEQAVFGGLILYLCEGVVSSQMLQRMRFVSEACLLLVTRDCKGLVREVSRLDLEEIWNFKLRDEFQTSCSDQNHPLFFLTGKYVLPNNDTS